MTQWVKDPALSLQQLGLLLWCRFDPWPGNLHMPQVWPPQKRVSIITLFTIRIGVEMSSHCGSMVANLTSIHEDLRLIPGLA